MARCPFSCCSSNIIKISCVQDFSSFVQVLSLQNRVREQQAQNVLMKVQIEQVEDFSPTVSVVNKSNRNVKVHTDTGQPVLKTKTVLCLGDHLFGVSSQILKFTYMLVKKNIRFTALFKKGYI